jgi:hypothetical protein
LRLVPKSKPKSERPPILEHDIQTAICEWLTLRRIFFYRQNAGGMKKGKHFVRFAVKGAPDIVCVIKGCYIGIEVKRPGGKQTPDQAAFQDQLILAGGNYVLAESLEDVKDALT